MATGEPPVVVESRSFAPRSCQRRSSGVSEKPFQVAGRSMCLLEVGPHERRRDGQQRDDLAASRPLPSEAHQRQTIEAKIRRTEIEHFLDAGTGVVEQGQHEIIAPACGSRPVRLREDRFDFVLGQIADDAPQGIFLNGTWRMRWASAAAAGS